MNYDLYVITCKITTKKYIGQCKQILSNGNKWGYKKRFKQHITSSLNKSSKCRKLMHSILKHGPNNHIVKLIKVCKESWIDEEETKYISLYKTLHPLGLNLETGGNKHKKII